MKKLKYTLIAMLLVSATGYADPPATHGMLLFGDKVTYASHLPMFHTPHDYQLIMKLSMRVASRVDTLGFYEQAKLDGITLFTLAPQVMDLTEVISGTKTSFLAHLFSGHFERGGENLGLISVEVEKIIYSKKLDGDQNSGKFHEYLLFGGDGEYFAAHLIKEKPSFDTVLKISKPTSFDFRCRKRACPDYLPNRDVILPARALAKKNSDGSFNLPKIGTQLSTFNTFPTKVKHIIYLETDELEH